MPRFVGTALDIPAATIATNAVRKGYVDTADAALSARVTVLEAGGGQSSGQTLAVRTTATAITAAAGDFVLADATAAPFTVTLPAAPETNAAVAVKKVDNTLNLVTVVGAGATTIDGDATCTLTQAQSGAVMVFDGTNWRVESTVIFDPGARNFTYRGTWINTVTYGINDVVYFNSSAYLAIVSNTGVTPTVDASSATWGLLVLHGDTGTPGAGIIPGGSTDQALVKTSGADFATAWRTIAEVPAGGSAGQVLTKGASTVDWADTSGGGGLTPSAVQISNVTALAGQLVLTDATAGSLTVTLPVATVAGVLVGVKKVDDSANLVTVVAPSGKTIDGDPDTTILAKNTVACFVYDGANWLIQSTALVDTAGGGTSGGTAGAVAKTGDTMTGLLDLADGGAGVGGLTIAGDTNLYRSTFGYLQTDCSLIVGTSLSVYGTAQFTGVTMTQGEKYNSVKVGDAYTIQATDRVVLATSTSPFVVTLPSAITAGNGTVLTVKNIDSGLITMGSAGGTVDGAAASTVTLAQWVVKRFISDGSNWFLI